jgi:hypothetical protein
MKLSINQLRKIISEEVRRFKINESQETVTVQVEIPSDDKRALLQSFGREMGIIDYSEIKSRYSTGAGPDSRATYPEDPGHWTIFHVDFASMEDAQMWMSSQSGRAWVMEILGDAEDTWYN